MSGVSEVPARMSRGCYEETAFVEFKLNGVNAYDNGAMFSAVIGMAMTTLDGVPAH